MTLIDTATAAYMLGCTPRHVRNLIARGVITNHGDGWRAMTSLQEINEGIRDGRITVQPSRPRRVLQHPRGMAD